jgi:transposase
MQGRQPDNLTLKKKDITTLQQLVRDGDTSLRVARRAQILLARASNQRVAQVVAKVDQHPATVWRVCERYRQEGLDAALYDAPRSGRPPVFSPKGASAN